MFSKLQLYGSDLRFFSCILLEYKYIYIDQEILKYLNGVYVKNHCLWHKDTICTHESFKSVLDDNSYLIQGVENSQSI